MIKTSLWLFFYAVLIIRNEPIIAAVFHIWEMKYSVYNMDPLRPPTNNHAEN
jgi:hypothetical protein